MLIRLVISVGLFLAWGVVCWNWYACNIKQVCNAPEPNFIEDSPPIVTNRPEAISSNSIEPVKENETKIIELADRIVIQFPFKEAVKDIEPEVDAYLEQLSKKLEQTNEVVHITGHTDNVGSERNNQELGFARARYIQDILHSKGIEDSRISIESKGENEPMGNNDTEVGRQQNRRVEIRLLTEGAE